MTIFLIISIFTFLFASLFDYRSSLGEIEANPLMRGKDGQISFARFVVGVAVVAAVAVAASFYELWAGAAIFFLGAALHLWAMAHNNKIKNR